MAYKSIVTIVTSAGQDAAALDAAIEMARREEAHLDVLCLGIDRTQPGFYYAGANAMIVQDNLANARTEAAALEEEISARMQGSDLRWSATSATSQMVSLPPLIAHRTRFADLVVLPRPYGEGRGHEHEAITEAALFNGHVPVLVIPDSGTFPETFGRAIVAWNESAEALAAIRAALPMLRRASAVDITIIDPPQHGPDRSDPGGELSQMLARHGVRPEVSVLAKTLPRISDIICRHADDKSADLVVMGAYGHSRFRESILGGATRNMLENSDLPVLMAH